MRSGSGHRAGETSCRRDKKAFVEIVHRYQNLVNGAALAILRDFSLSEDAAQETFVVAWQKLGTLKEPEKLGPWLIRIARNTALNHVKKQRPTDLLDTSIIDQKPRPDEVAITRDEQALVLSVLDSLLEKYRLPMILYYREDQSVRTVAKALSQSEATVCKQLSRGRKLLKSEVVDLFGSGLARTSPGPVFTATVASLIGAMLKPTAVAAIIAAVCIPIGYTARALIPVDQQQGSQPHPTTTVTAERRFNKHTPSALEFEWQQLLASCQNDPKAFPDLYQTITAIPGSPRSTGLVQRKPPRPRCLSSDGGPSYPGSVERRSGPGRSLDPRSDESRSTTVSALRFGPDHVSSERRRGNPGGCRCLAARLGRLRFGGKSSRRCRPRLGSI